MLCHPSLMNILPLSCVVLVVLVAALFPDVAVSQNLDLTGVTLFRALTTNLDGTGIRVAQTEAMVGANAWEVDSSQSGLPGRFSYYSSAGSATVYPNSVGSSSWHAQLVATNFYVPLGGVATNVLHVDNFGAMYFYNYMVSPTTPPNCNDSIVNQSWIFNGLDVSTQRQVDSGYDNYAARYNTLFVSGAGNGGPVSAPSTCYNGIAVAVCDGTSSYGPTPDNGRSKPDLTAPGFGTSYSTPYVSGSAAVLLQAALRGDGGSDTNSAADIRTLKALLLNGAVKPIGWTNSSSAPLDTRYGAGILNLFNSYKELSFGKYPFINSDLVASGGSHPPSGATGTVNANNGWDFNSIVSTQASNSVDAVNHYYFNLTGAVYTATATLVWNRQANQNSINNLGLFLYDTTNSNLIAQSTSPVDNVQHIFLPRLAAGRYDLQVWKAGGANIVSTNESYALVWAFPAPMLTVGRAGANVTLSWAVYPAGYAVEATTKYPATGWGTNNLPGPVFTTGTNTVTVPATAARQVFRLQQPGS